MTDIFATDEAQNARDRQMATDQQTAQSAAAQQYSAGVAGAAAAQNRTGYNMQMGGADAAAAQAQGARGGQMGLAGMLQSATQGGGPSVAVGQQQLGQAQAAQGAMAQAAGAKGAGGLLAARGAVQSGAGVGLQVANQSSAARAQEIAQARGDLGNVAGQMRGQDLTGMQTSMQQQGALAQNAYQQRGMNDAMSQASIKQQEAAGAADTGLAGQMQQENVASREAAAQQEATNLGMQAQDYSEEKSLIGAGTGFLESMFGAMSDPDTKENITPETDNGFDQLQSYFSGIKDTDTGTTQPESGGGVDWVQSGQKTPPSGDDDEDSGVGAFFKALGSGTNGAKAFDDYQKQQKQKNPLQKDYLNFSSDPENKRNTAYSGGDLADMLRKAPPFSFDYKEPEVDGEGRRYGVMTTDLKKSLPGSQMVRETPRGEMVDGRAAMSTTLAQLSNLQNQIDEMTKKLGTIKAGKRGAAK